MHASQVLGSVVVVVDVVVIVDEVVEDVVDEVVDEDDEVVVVDDVPQQLPHEQSPIHLLPHSVGIQYDCPQHMSGPYSESPQSPHI